VVDLSARPWRRLRPSEVEPASERTPLADVSVHWLVEGWPQDVRRGIESFRRNEGDRSVRHVVVDVVEGDPATWPDGVELLPLVPGTGWAAARNAGLRRAASNIVFVLDGSVEATGDVYGPIERALADPGVGIAGPFGLVTSDLREFTTSPGPDVDAIEAYLMAFRREVLTESGTFDERFTFYRSADLELSFRVKDHGYRAVTVDLPVRRHAHRRWDATPPEERDRLSRRNFNRFLDRFRDRFDLCVRPGGFDPG